MELVLSIFPGVDLLGRAFAAAGYCVVMGPDPLTGGGDIRDFHVPPRKFDGVIGGPPCQGFSTANRFRDDPTHPSVVNSRALLREFVRVVHVSRPAWFLCENVPGVPDIKIPGYEIQRFPVSDAECGGVQIRTRHFQFGHVDGWICRPKRVNHQAKTGRKPVAITTKPVSKWESYALHCRKQGLKNAVSLPGWTKDAKFRAIGNAVSMNVGRVVAAAVKCASLRTPADCPCGCGRELSGNQRAATASCRKRLQLSRERARDYVDLDGFHQSL